MELVRMEFDDGKPIEDHEYPEPDDEDDESESIVCANCGSSVYEDAFECPICGSYLSQPTSPWTGRPAWWMIIGILGLTSTIVVMSCAI